MAAEKKICLVIEVHQPIKLRTYRFFEISDKHYYYDDYTNDFNINKLVQKYYIPGNTRLMDLIHYSKKEFNFSLLFSGIVLDQFELYYPEIIDSFKSLLDTGCVELLSGTYSNLFGPPRCKSEYNNQIRLQQKKIKSIFKRNPVPTTIKDIYNYHGDMSAPRPKMIVANAVSNRDNLNMLMDINMTEWLCRPEKILKYLDEIPEDENVTVNLLIPYNLFLDAEKDTGILEFLERFPVKVLSRSDFKFGVPSSTAADFNAGLQPAIMQKFAGKIQGSFLEKYNKMQVDAFRKLYSCSNKIDKCDDIILNKDWLYLQACDHFHLMDPSLYENRRPDGIYIPYDSHFLAYINYMNILTDFSARLDEWLASKSQGQALCQDNFEGKQI